MFVLLGFASRSAKETAAWLQRKGKKLKQLQTGVGGFVGCFCFRFLFGSRLLEICNHQTQRSKEQLKLTEKGSTTKHL